MLLLPAACYRHFIITLFRKEVAQGIQNFYLIYDFIYADLIFVLVTIVVKFFIRICNEGNAIVKELYSFIVFFTYLIYCTVAAENVRASREKSGNQQLANLPTCYYKYVYVILCIQSCPILHGINILSSTVLYFLPQNDRFQLRASD